MATKLREKKNNQQQQKQQSNIHTKNKQTNKKYTTLTNKRKHSHQHLINTAEQIPMDEADENKTGRNRGFLKCNTFQFQFSVICNV